MPNMSTAKKGSQDEQNLIEIKKTRVIDAPADIVFKTITDPAELTNWFPDHAILEPRVGGKIRLSFYKEKSTELERDHLQEGTIKEFIPGKKVSYTWQFKDTPELTETIVTWELEEIDDKKTRVVLNHSGFTGKEIGKLSSAEFDNGWTYFFGQIGKIL